MPKNLHYVALAGLLALTGCNSAGSFTAGPLDDVSLGDKFSYQNQYFIVSDISQDQSSITLQTYTEGFNQALHKATFALTKAADGTFRFASESLQIVYDPTTGQVTWGLLKETTIDGLVNELVDNGIEISLTNDLVAIYPDRDDDGQIDVVDADDDGDGYADSEDELPLDPTARFADIITVSAGDQITLPTLRPNGTQVTASVISSDYDPLVLDANVLRIEFVDSGEAFTLDDFVRTPDGLFQMEIPRSALRLTYDPSKNSISWSQDSSLLPAELTDLTGVMSASHYFDLGFLPTVFQALVSIGSIGDWTPGIASAVDTNPYTGEAISGVQDLYSFFEAEIRKEWANDAFASQFNTLNDDISYANVSVDGLKAAHDQGWTGLGTILADVANYSDCSFVYNELLDTISWCHAVNVEVLIASVAPETDVLVLGDRSDNTDFTGRQYSNSIDAINISMGVEYTKYSTSAEAKADAATFLDYKFKALGDATNAVIVTSAGNNGIPTGLSASLGCVVVDGHNTADSCTDIELLNDPTLYDYIDRTIFVGAYDYDTETLADYSVAAGGAADRFIVAAGNSILDQTEGTSFAAPRVTGVVGLVAQKFPNLTPEARSGLILDTATDLGDPGVDAVYGHGLLNVTNALNPLGMLQ